MKSLERGIKNNSEFFMYSKVNENKNVLLSPKFVGNFYYEKGYFIERETYDSILLMWIKNGSCEIAVKNDVFIAKEGQIVLINCYKWHSYEMLEDANILWLHFDGDNAKQFFDIATNNEKNLVFDSESNIDVRFKLERLYESFLKNMGFSDFKNSFIITDILTDIIDGQEKGKNGTKIEVVDRAVSYISQNFAKDISLDVITNELNVSEYHFIRIFKKSIGVSPYKYIMNKRIEYAKYLLKNTSHTIKEICYMCGYNNESTFSAAFRQLAQKSPSIYRTTK